MLPLPGAFRAWRQARGWSQKELARRATDVAQRRTGNPTAGISLTTVAMIETGDRDPSGSVLAWLAEALTVEPSALAFVCPADFEPCGCCRGKAFVRTLTDEEDAA